MELLHREHSIFKREAIVMKSGKLVRKFIKNTNKHCFPIFPRFNPKTHQRHQFVIPGWNYYMDTSDVEFLELEVPVFEEENWLSEDYLSIQSSHVLPPKITVRSIIEDGLQAEVVSRVNQSANVILSNQRSAFLALEEEEEESKRKRDDK